MKKLFNGQKNIAAKFTPGTQTALYEEHVLSGCAEVVPIMAMLLSNTKTLWLLLLVYHQNLLYEQQLLMPLK
jgi:hypothetical protein